MSLHARSLHARSHHARSHHARRTAVALAITTSAVALAVTAQSTATADPIEVNPIVASPFQAPVTFFMGDPVPVATQTLMAAPLGNGRVEFATTATGPLATGPIRYSVAVDIHWTNLSTGASGITAIPNSTYPAASAEAFATTGPGPVIAYATTTGTHNTLVPGFGVFSAR